MTPPWQEIEPYDIRAERPVAVAGSAVQPIAAAALMRATTAARGGTFDHGHVEVEVLPDIDVKTAHHRRQSGLRDLSVCGHGLSLFS